MWGAGNGGEVIKGPTDEGRESWFAKGGQETSVKNKSLYDGHLVEWFRTWFELN